MVESESCGRKRKREGFSEVSRSRDGGVVSAFAEWSTRFQREESWC